MQYLFYLTVVGTLHFVNLEVIVQITRSRHKQRMTAQTVLSDELTEVDIIVIYLVMQYLNRYWIYFT